MRLTRDEIILVTGILAALVTGAIVKHYRETERVAAIERNLSAGKPTDAAKQAQED
jgi:hypothetical protein